MQRDLLHIAGDHAPLVRVFDDLGLPQTEVQTLCLAFGEHPGHALQALGAVGMQACHVTVCGRLDLPLHGQTAVQKIGQGLHAVPAKAPLLLQCAGGLLQHRQAVRVVGGAGRVEIEQAHDALCADMSGQVPHEVRHQGFRRPQFGQLVEGGDPLQDGWFPTGDVATIDADGYMQITDRSKDVIKSGGEWISSIDIENIAVAHPAVAMAACIGIKHPKWDERPIVVVVKKPDAQVNREDLLKFYEGKTAKWQIPDDVVFVDAIPIGATGKMLKTKLREQLADYVLPTA